MTRDQSAHTQFVESGLGGDRRRGGGTRERGRVISFRPAACVTSGGDTTWKPLKKRVALEAKVAQEGGGLTGAQLVTLEDRQREQEAHGECERECPGDCDAQDTFSVGTLKGVGRIYQHTFSDPCPKVGVPTLDIDKTPVTARTPSVTACCRSVPSTGFRSSACCPIAARRRPIGTRLRSIWRWQHRAYPDEDEAPADPRHLRTLQPNPAQ